MCGRKLGFRVNGTRKTTRKKTEKAEFHRSFSATAALQAGKARRYGHIALQTGKFSGSKSLPSAHRFETMRRRQRSKTRFSRGL
jgi:hypothetical protein